MKSLGLSFQRLTWSKVANGRGMPAHHRPYTGSTYIPRTSSLKSCMGHRTPSPVWQLAVDVGVRHASLLEFRYSVACEAGGLAVTVLDSNGTRTPLFSGEQLHDSGTQVIPVASGSKYRLEIKGEKARGTYEVAWAPVAQP